jgi:predicted TIM-barrel fold metal-dependent hydrolase
MKLNRRSLLAAGAAALTTPEVPAANQAGTPLELARYEPRSMLQVRETQVVKARYPVIDIHTHLSFSAQSEKGVNLSPARVYLADPGYLLPIMDRNNIRTLTNLTGGFGNGLAEAIQKYDRSQPGRFVTFTEPSYNLFLDPNYPKLQAQAIADAHAAGAKGLKIVKTLGLYLRENITNGPLVKVDDPRFDPMWDTCAQLNMPVAIRFNERYEELNNHPDWSFYGRDFPSNEEILAARNRVFARHPKTQFIALHVGNFAENLENVSQNLDRFPNMHVDIAARIGELGRQPRTARAFFERYSNRILFGTDATPHGDQFPQQVYGDQLYEIYFRFLETDDEYFDYAPAPVPPQGRWRIYGVNLPDNILRQLYHDNAARLLNI